MLTSQDMCCNMNMKHMFFRHTGKTGPSTLWGPRTLWGPSTLWAPRTLWGPWTLWGPRISWAPRILWGPGTIGGSRTLWEPRTLRRLRAFWGPRTPWGFRFLWRPRKDPRTWFPHHVFSLVEFTIHSRFTYHCWMQIKLTRENSCEYLLLI